MGGEGHMLDMIRRLKDGKDASRLRRERNNEKMRRLRAGDSYPLPDTTSEEMGRIIRQTEKKKEADDRFFVFGTLIVIAALLLSGVILWVIFFR